MKNRILSTLFTLAMALVLSSTSQADGVAHRKLGAGIHLGEPMGATVRYFIIDKFALDATTGYALGEQGFVVETSGLFHLRDILDYDGGSYSIVPFVGAGLKFGADMGGAHDGDGIFAMQFPIGASFVMSDGAFEVSAEIRPGVEFAPSDEFDFTGGIGIRYYFF